MPTPLRVLILEDRPADAELMLHELREAGFDVVWQCVETEEDYLAALDARPALILADYSLPQFDALQALRLLKQRGLDVPFIMVTGSLSEAAAVMCIKEGASDYLLKDRLARLGPAVRRALKEKRLRDEKWQAEEALRESAEEYRLLFEDNPCPMWIYDPQTLGFLEANDAAVYTYGYTRDELFHMTVPDLHPEEERAALEERLQRTRAPLVRLGGWRQRRKDGAIIEVEMTSHALSFFGSDAVLVIVQDVTERQRTDRENRRRKQELESLLEISQQFTRRLDLDTLLDRVVESVIEMLPGAEAATLWLYDEKTSHLAARAWQGHADASMQGLVAAPERHLPGLVMRRQEPLVVPDLARSTGFERLNRPSLNRVRATLGVPLRVDERRIGALIADSFSKTNAFDAWEGQLLQMLAAQAAIAIQNGRLFKNVRAMSLRLLQAQESERRRIAQDLHDEVGGVLTALRLNLRMYSEDAGAAHADLVEAETLVETLMDKIRQVILDLRPVILDTLGLLPALQALFQRYTAQTGVAVRFHHELSIEVRFAPEVETTAYRVVQEALTNVVRHAGVPEAQVLLYREPHDLIIHVIDEGSGFDASAGPAHEQSMGLSGMQERLLLLGGTVEVSSVPGAGTRITARLPLG